jgi:hypothetical protein
MNRVWLSATMLAVMLGGSTAQAEIYGFYDMNLPALPGFEKPIWEFLVEDDFLKGFTRVYYNGDDTKPIFDGLLTVTGGKKDWYTFRLEMVLVEGKGKKSILGTVHLKELEDGTLKGIAYYTLFKFIPIIHPVVGTPRDPYNGDDDV